jgi:hypothetical protein
MKQKSRNISCRGFLLPAAFGLLLILSAVALGVHSVGLRVIDQLTIEARAQKALSFSGASMLTELLNNPGNPGLRRGGFPFIECKLENRKLVKKLKYREGFCSQNSNFSYERFSGRYSGTLAQSSSLNLPLFDLSGLSAAINPVKCLNDNAPISQRLSAGSACR